MKHIRWYDKDSNLKAVFEFIEKLELPVQAEIAKDIIQILVTELNIDLDSNINSIGTKSYEYKRWYDKNMDLFSSFELIKNLPDAMRYEVVKKIIESVLLMYFEGKEVNGEL